jgi:exopolysaccharide production protein ExoZ
LRSKRKLGRMRTFTGIQAMRGVAASSVVCGHAVTMRFGMGIQPEHAFNALGLLQAGVDVFFVVSGFIIANTAAESGAKLGRFGALQFAIKRVGRIFPLYWLVLVATVASSYWIVVFPGAPAGELDHVRLEHIFSLTVENYFVAPAWSLCYELYFYAAVAAIMLVAPRYTLGILVLACGALAGADLLTSLHLGIYSTPLTLEFAFGVGIAYLVQHGFHPSRPIVTLAVAFCLFATGAYFASGGHSIGAVHRLLTYGAGSALVIYAVVAGELNGARFPAWLQYLGAVSYALYVSHHLLLTWLAKYNPARIPGPLQIAIWISLSLVVGIALHEFLERPLLARLKISMPKVKSAARGELNPAGAIT